MLRQIKVSGRVGLSDFSWRTGATITPFGVVFKPYFTATSWPSMAGVMSKSIVGEREFTALPTGLQNAFLRGGGVPLERRTDSLSVPTTIRRRRRS
jgi:hypothetical protein